MHRSNALKHSKLFQSNENQVNQETFQIGRKTEKEEMKRKIPENDFHFSNWLHLSLKRYLPLKKAPMQLNLSNV